MACVPASCWITLSKTTPNGAKRPQTALRAGPPVPKWQLSFCSWLRTSPSAAEPPASLLTPCTVCWPFWRGLPRWGKGHRLFRAEGTALCLPHGCARPGAKSRGLKRKSPSWLCPRWTEGNQIAQESMSGCKLLSDRGKRSTEPGRPLTRHFVSFGGGWGSGQRGLPGGSDNGLELILSNHFHACFRHLNGGLAFL